jgi:hypothetical protein
MYIGVNVQVFFFFLVWGKGGRWSLDHMSIHMELSIWLNTAFNINLDSPMN